MHVSLTIQVNIWYHAILYGVVAKVYRDYDSTVQEV